MIHPCACCPQYRWAMWKINDAGTEVVISAVGPKDSAYDSFLQALPAADCRFAGATRRGIPGRVCLEGVSVCMSVHV